MPEQRAPKDGDLDNLAESVGRLADQLQVVGNSLDAIREDLNWLTRNPLQIKLDGGLHSSRWPREFSTDSVIPHSDEINVSPEICEAAGRLVASLQQVLATVTVEQFQTVIDTLDEAHSLLLTLMRGEIRQALHARQETAEAAQVSASASRERAIPSTTASDNSSTATAPTVNPPKPDRPGRLF